MSVADSPICPTDLEPPAEAPMQLPRWLWGIAVFVGVGLAGLGAALVALPFLLPVLFGAAGIIGASYGLIAGTLGVALVFAGSQGRRRAPVVRFYSRRAWLYFLLGSLGVALLAVLLPRELQHTPLFAPFHFFLILLPALLILSLLALLAGPRSAVAVRHLLLAAAGGAASVFLAIPLELVGLLLSGIVAIAVTWLIPGGTGEVERLITLLQSWSVQPPTDGLEVLGLLASPVVLLALALLLGVITPLVEEFVKTLVLGIMGIWMKPSTLVSFLLGVACGLGFAWLEGISNGALGLGETAGWLGGVAVRVFATAMHALTSGLLGIGWAYLWRGKGWVLLVSYIVAVVFHGLWNLNVIVSLGGMAMAVSSPAVGGLLTLLAVGFQIVLIGLCLSALIAIPLVWRRRAAARAGLRA
jgi:hypothetical protein